MPTVAISLPACQKLIRRTKKHYVYVLMKPCGTPFYVGVGRGNRVAAHERDARCKSFHTHKLATIRKIWREGGKVGYRIDSSHELEADALKREVELIAEIGRADLGTGPLTNATGGGEGVRNLNTEAERLRAEASAATRRTDKCRQKNASNGRNWHESHPELSQQSVSRLNAGNRRWLEEFPLLVAARRAKMSVAQRRPDVIAKRVSSLKKLYTEQPEVLAKRRKQLDSARKTSARVENLRAALNGDEYRKKKSAQMKAHWANPENRARVAAAVREGKRRAKEAKLLAQGSINEDRQGTTLFR